MAGGVAWLFNIALFVPPVLFLGMIVWIAGGPERSAKQRSARVIAIKSSPAIGPAAAPSATASAPASGTRETVQAPSTPDRAPSTTDARPDRSHPTGKPGPAATTVSLASAGKGEELFNAYCIACHQPGGHGKVGFAPDVRNPDFLALASDEFLRRTIVQGRAGTAMTGWAHLEKEDVESLIAYIRTAEDPDNALAGLLDPSRAHPGDPANGEILYGRYCAACHGVEAHGYVEGGPGPAIGNEGFLAVASDDFIYQTVKHGRVGTPMRAFSGARGLADLSDQEIGDVIAYLRTKGGASPATASSGRPDPVEGKTHFDAHCAACHQPNAVGRPGFAPSIGNPDFLALASDEFIKETIRRGRPGTAMVPRPDLSEAVIDQIIAYLRSLPTEEIPEIELDPDKDLAALGDAALGHTKFTTYCASCHGPEGQGYVVGGAGPGIGLPGFLASASDDFIYKTLEHGRVHTAMRSFLGAKGLANLDEQDAYDLIAYLRNLGTSGN